QPVEVRRVAELHGVRNDLRADALQEAEALVADGGDLHAGAGALELAQLAGDRAQHVRVQAAAQALVGGDDDDAEVALLLAHDEERMTVLGVRVRQVRGDVAHLVGVRTRLAHAVLRLAHLRRGDHLHRLRDLARVLHALDLGADLFAARHFAVLTRALRRGAQYAPVFLKSCTASCSCASTSFVNFLSRSIVSTSGPYLLRTNSRIARSASSALATSMSSK